MKIQFQGKNITRRKDTKWHYKWVAKNFDIREVREKFNKKPILAIDWDFNLHPCTRFETIINGFIDMVGDTDFKGLIEELDNK